MLKKKQINKTKKNNNEPSKMKLKLKLETNDSKEQNKNNTGIILPMLKINKSNEENKQNKEKEIGKKITQDAKLPILGNDQNKVQQNKKPLNNNLKFLNMINSQAINNQVLNNHEEPKKIIKLKLVNTKNDKNKKKDDTTKQSIFNFIANYQQYKNLYNKNNDKQINKQNKQFYLNGYTGNTKYKKFKIKANLYNKYHNKFNNNNKIFKNQLNKNKGIQKK